jgi:hypothetical protein
MIWVVKQFITHQILEMGGGRVRLKRYVELNERDLDLLVEKRFEKRLKIIWPPKRLPCYVNNHCCCALRGTLGEERREK